VSDDAIVINLADIPPEVREQIDELYALVGAVDKEKPKRQAVAKLQEWLDEIPGLWAVFGDLNSLVQRKIVDRLVSLKSVAMAIETGVDLKRQELGYEYSPPLERLLIDHALVCWLRLQDAEWQYTQKINSSMTLALGDYWERRLSAAQRRYLRACETLARVRKVIRRTPALQVNIAAQGGQQVNIAGDLPSGKRE
jgi:hypothetical protein